MENTLFDVAKNNIVRLTQHGIRETPLILLGSTTSLVARLLESHTHEGQVSHEDIQEIKGVATVLYAGTLVSFLCAA